MKQCTTAEQMNLCVPQNWICEQHVDCNNYDFNICDGTFTLPWNTVDNALCHLHDTWIPPAIICDENSNSLEVESKVYCLGEL